MREGKDYLHIIIELLEAIMANQADLDATVSILAEGVNTLGGDLETKLTGLAQQITDLQAQVGTTVDLQPQIDAINSITSQIQSLDSTLH